MTHDSKGHMIIEIYTVHCVYFLPSLTLMIGLGKQYSYVDTV